MSAQNEAPSGGGDITKYSPVPDTDPKYNEYALRVSNVSFPVTTEADLVFVNGMNNSPENHRRAARQLATITGQSVSGIYNQTGINGKEGFPNAIIDAIQCVQDQFLPVGRSSNLLTGFRYMSHPVASLAVGLARTSGLSRLSVVRKAERLAGEAVLSMNQASVALFRRLYHNAENGRKTIVVCHSQGNLISANALWVLKHTRSWADRPVGNVRLFGLASPNASWPPNSKDGLKFTLYRDDRDPITLLSVPVVGQKPVTNRGPGYSMSTHKVASYFAFERFQKDLAKAL